MSSYDYKKFPDIGSAIKHILNINNLTQEELGELIDKNSVQISRWVNNKNKPNERTIYAIGKATGFQIIERDDNWLLKKVISDQINDNSDYEVYRTESDKDLAIKELKAQVNVLMDVIIKLKTQNRQLKS